MRAGYYVLLKATDTAALTYSQMNIGLSELVLRTESQFITSMAIDNVYSGQCLLTDITPATDQQFVVLPRFLFPTRR